MTLEAQDPSLRLQHHYVRRGDAVLNIDKNRGFIDVDPNGVTGVVQAAQNTQEQQDREVPVLGLRVDWQVDFPLDPLILEVERGQECWDLIQQVARSATGPDIDIRPHWTFPVDRQYADCDLYLPPTDPDAPAVGELGRNLDPTDPDAPAAGDVVFDLGLGLDNLVELTETPGRPTTHVHVLDSPGVYRVTAADADSSAAVGVFVDWVGVDFTIPRSTPSTPADTNPLLERANAHIRAYGKPVKHFTCTLRPDDVQTRHYGHPRWAAEVPGSDPGGTWYLGDYVRIRGLRGQRSFSTLARIVGVTFKQEGSNGLPQLDVRMIPAIGGSPGEDPQED